MRGNGQKIGKIDIETFKSFVQGRLGRPDPSVLVPPMTGVDAGVIDLSDGRVLVVAEDPIFAVPGQPFDMFGWYAVHIGASDVAVMGVRPMYMTYTLLMPPDTKDDIFYAIVDSIHREALELGIAVVGGHTGYYPGFAAPTIGGITVFSIARRDEFVTPAGAKAADDVILTKGPAIEAAGLLAVLHESRLLESYPPSLVQKGKDLCRKMTVVADAMAAASVGVHAMHDATEGGVIGGLFEIASASGVGMEIDESLFVYPREVKMVCDSFSLDPIAAIAEGALLIACDKKQSQDILARLKEIGIDASVIGKVTSDPQVRTIRRLDGRVVPLEMPQQDPFWPVFFKGE